MSKELKKGWKWVKLGDVATEYTVRGNPSDSEYDRFVGSSNIGQFDLRVMDWGDTSEVSSEMKVFQPGDYLFVRRSLYASDFRERAARADFSGLCSGDILTIREKEDVIADGFLAAVLNHPRIWEYVVAKATGSITRRIKWKQLAEYEFPLPPVDEQRRIADLLWAADDAIEAYRDLLTKTENLLNSKMREVMQNPNWKTEPLEKLATVERGKFAHRPRNLPQFYGGNYPFVQTGDIARCRGNLTTYDQTLSEEGKALSKSFPTGSIMMTIAAVIGKTAITTFETWATDSVVGIVPKNIDVHFLEFYLRTQQQHLDSVVATQTAQKNINLAVLRPLQIPVPSKEEQKEVAGQLLEIQNSIELQEDHIAKSVELKKQLLNKMLSG